MSSSNSFYLCATWNWGDPTFDVVASKYLKFWSAFPSIKVLGIYADKESAEVVRDTLTECVDDEVLRDLLAG